MVKNNRKKTSLDPKVIPTRNGFQALPEVDQRIVNAKPPDVEG